VKSFAVSSAYSIGVLTTNTIIAKMAGILIATSGVGFFLGKIVFNERHCLPVNNPLDRLLHHFVGMLIPANMLQQGSQPIQITAEALVIVFPCLDKILHLLF
jgi:hypothetical protein